MNIHMREHTHTRRRSPPRVYNNCSIFKRYFLISEREMNTWWSQLNAGYTIRIHYVLGAEEHCDEAADSFNSH